jgi:hypothetical protein
VSDTTPLNAALPRRRFLAIGGFSVATAAVLAACGGGEVKTRVAQAGVTPETVAPPERVTTDAVLMRTASSLSHSAAAAYEKAIGMNLLTGEALEFAKVFHTHHQAAAKFFEDQTAAVGGTPFTEANPVVAANVIDPVFAALPGSADQAGDLRNFLHSLEDVVTETCQSFVPMLSVPKLRAALTSVGSIGARQSSVWAAILGGPVAASLAPKAAVTTTVKGAVEAVTVPVYQAPSAFSAMGLVPTLLNGKKVDLDLLGPNSYAY